LYEHAISKSYAISMSKAMINKLPFLGFGLGLRTDHYQEVLETKPDIDWFEIITENYLVPGGKPLHYLERVREHYPVVMHGVAMSIGGSETLDFTYLEHVKSLANNIEAKWISDHLCWTSFGGHNSHDLLPLPYSAEALDHVVNRINIIQDYLGRQILVENVSSYVDFVDSEIPEWEFLSLVAKKSGCYLLLDINNVYVSAYNHHFDPIEYIDSLPAAHIQQIHLAGHTNCGTHIIDTHDQSIIDEVWDLYAYTIKRYGEISTMIERDDNIPPLNDLKAELDFARHCFEQALQSELEIVV